MRGRRAGLHQLSANGLFHLLGLDAPLPRELFHGKASLEFEGQLFVGALPLQPTLTSARGPSLSPSH